MNSHEERPITFNRAIEALFLAMIFSLGFMQPDVRIMGLPVTITDALFLVTGTVWAAAVILGKVKFRSDPAYYFFAAYGAALLLSVIMSDDMSISARKFPAELYLIGLSVLTFNIVSSRERTRGAITAWLAASAVTSVIGVMTVASYYLGLKNLLKIFSVHQYGSLPPGH
jgi:hypothetical protein